MPRALLYALLFTAAYCNQSRADLIPIEKLLSPPVLRAPLISPDGQQISYVAIHNGAANLWVAPADDFASAKPVTDVPGQGITSSNVAGYVTYRWTADSRYLLYLQDQSGNERWHLMSVEVATGIQRDLTPVEDAQVRLVATSTQRPGEVLVEINDRRPDRHDLYRVELASGERTRVTENNRFIGFFADNQLAPRLAIAAADDGGFDIFRLMDNQWQEFFHLEQKDTSALIRAVEQGAWSFSKDNQRFRIYDSRGRDTWAIAAIDLETGETRSLARNERVDIDSALYHPVSGALQAYRANWTRSEWHTTGPGLAADFQYLEGLAEGEIAISNRSVDGMRWLVQLIPGNASPELYLYDAGKKRAKHLATLVPGLAGLNLPPVQPVVIESSDGLPLVSYLILPDSSEIRSGGVPESPVPMVVYVHGGPNDERAVYRFHPYLQWLANRGYAVLDVNYRGSPGFGKDYLNAQNLEWGNKMHRDVVDQVQWAIRKGIADQYRIGIFGGSYGGYEVLVAMTKTPDLFACGADLAGPSEMQRFIKIWWENFIPADNMAYKSIVLGNPQTEAGVAALRKSSPLYFAHQAKNPVLVVQGAQDSRVPVEQAELIVDRFAEADVPVTYVLFPEEGHGVVRPGNRSAFFAILEAFFGNCLGGSFQPITDQLSAAGLEIPVGAELIPGLQEALIVETGEGGIR